MAVWGNNQKGQNREKGEDNLGVYHSRTIYIYPWYNTVF